jgi:broad specificity phosphatase PhoE
MTRIILVRHGHVAGINPPRFRGRTDLALTDRGKDEARQVADRIAIAWSPRTVYTSPLSRCVDTGAEISQRCGAPLRTLEEINDLDYGEWQGKSWDEARAIGDGLFDIWRHSPDQVLFPSGESLQGVAGRASRALRYLSEHHPNETVVVVSHDSVNRVILALALALPLSSYWRLVQDPCCINEIECDGDWTRVCRMNDTAHLAPKVSSALNA